MNSEKYHGNQASCSQRAAKYSDQLSLLAIVRELEDIADDIAYGRQVKTLHAIQDLSARVLDDMRQSLADHRSLAAYKPIHEIDFALHRLRRKLLEKRARAEGWAHRWDNDTFVVEDDKAGVFLTVDGADNWSLSTDGTRDFLTADCGLSALLSALNGTSLAEEVSRLSRWLDRHEASNA
jgi:hypothetical protein